LLDNDLNLITVH